MTFIDTILFINAILAGFVIVFWIIHGLIYWLADMEEIMEFRREQRKLRKRAKRTQRFIRKTFLKYKLDPETGKFIKLEDEGDK